MKTKQLLALAAVGLLLPFTACAIQDRYDANSLAEEIQTEVTDVNFLSYKGMTVGGTFIEFQSEEKKLVEYDPSEWQDGYYEWSSLTEYGYLYSHQYAIRHSGEDDFSDIGIFLADVRTGEFSILKNLKDVTRFQRYSLAHISVISALDGDDLILHYNGMLEVFNITTCETVYSARVYENPEQYARLEQGANAKFVGMDYMFMEDGAFDYYVYVGGAFEKYTFTDPRFTDAVHLVKRYGDTLYVIDAEPSEPAPFYAVNFRTGERIPDGELNERLKQDRAASEEDETEETREYQIGDARYHIAEDAERQEETRQTVYRSLTLTDVETGEEISAVTALKENKILQEFENIYAEYFPEAEYEFSLCGWNTDRGRLFLLANRPLFRMYFGWNFSPTFVFEFLPASGELKYCGFCDDSYNMPDNLPHALVAEL